MPVRPFAPVAMIALLAACGGSAPDATQPTPSAIEGPPQVPVMGREVRILAFGDSLLAGYGLEQGQSYPAQLEAALRARGINARIVNAGVSGDTSGDGLQRLEFTLKSQPAPPELVIISLGGNDMLRALPPEQTLANLDAMLKALKAKGIPVLLMGMLAPPNLGKDYAARFDPIYPTLAKKYGARLVPFFLQALMDRPDLVQADKMHPTDAGVEAIVAATIGTVTAALPKDR